MTVTWLLATVMGNNKIDNSKRCRKIAGNFDHHGDESVQSGVHRPIKHIKGFTRNHWMPPSGSFCAVLPWRPPWSQFWWKTQNTNKNGIVGQSRKSWEFWVGECICLFVYLYCILYLYQKIPLKKQSSYLMKMSLRELIMLQSKYVTSVHWHHCYNCHKTNNN
jgi:hypothetical protein